MVIHSTNNEHQAEGREVECEGRALYGSECGRLTKELEKKWQVFINESLRNILRIWGLEKSAIRSFGDKPKSDR